jgi:hypothetical protein
MLVRSPDRGKYGCQLFDHATTAGDKNHKSAPFGGLLRPDYRCVTEGDILPGGQTCNSSSAGWDNSCALHPHHPVWHGIEELVGDFGDVGLIEEHRHHHVRLVHRVPRRFGNNCAGTVKGCWFVESDGPTPSHQLRRAAATVYPGTHRCGIEYRNAHAQLCSFGT